MRDRQNIEVEEMETEADLQRDATETRCPICEKVPGDEWNGCLCLHDEPLSNEII